MDIFKRLEDSGVSVDAFINKHKFLHAIPLIIDEIALSIKYDYAQAGLYKQDVKQRLESVTKACERYDSYFWNKVADKSELAATQYNDLVGELVKKLIEDKDLWIKYVK